MPMNEGDTPPFWYAVFRGEFKTVRSAPMGPYAVRINSVISYADIIF